MNGFLIHSAVERWAKEAPEAAALIFQGKRMSYAELERASNQLARRLVADGLPRQGRVGVFMRKGLALGPAIYGPLKAGGAFVPLDPAAPATRVAFMIEDCGIEHVIADDRQAPALREVAEALGPKAERVSVYGVAEDVGFRSVSASELDGEPTGTVSVKITDQDLAYIMYTSGSTGQPKGMMHSHRGSLSYSRWGVQHVGMTDEDRVASHAPLHFDLSIFDFFSTSQAGAAVVLVPEPVTKFPASWTELMESESVSIVFTVPFTLIEMLERGALEKRDLGPLRWILFGGEAFPPKHLAALMVKLPGVRFTNVYGPAEAPSCTCYDVPMDFAERPVRDDEPIPIGTVSEGSDDLILNDDDEPCELNESGELCIRSTTLTLGYWNRPELNKRAFCERPGLGPFPEIWFRTGDSVLRTDDGLLQFLGRRDRMVKTRGHRVELDEVEAALASHPGVLEAAAFTVPDAGGSVAIMACVRLADAANLTPAAIQTHARTRLPAYALPREIEIVTAFPRTTSGKIDRRTLQQR